MSTAGLATAPPALGGSATPRAGRAQPGFRRLAAAAATCTYALIVMGGVVRVTDSGLGCPDWPTCYGSLIPPPDPRAWIEWTHRSLTLLASALMLATTGAAWLWRRHDPLLLVAATLVPVLLAVQIALGRVVVLLELPAMVVLVHLGFALAILGVLVWLATTADPARRAAAGAGGSGRRFARLVALTGALLFALLLAGAYVRATGASWACAGFPECNGQGVLPFGQSRLMDIQLLHRLLAYVVAVLVGWMLLEALRGPRPAPALRTAVWLLAAAVLAQAAIGATAVSTGVPPLLQGLHVAGAAAAWSAMVAVASLTHRSGRPGPAPPATPPGGTRAVGRTLSAYARLTKPKVMSLLLATTAASMVVAARGLPPVGLLCWTLLGGALMAGGAGAINHYVDRDIDPLMGRTAWRPIPSGAVAPVRALWFGALLGALACVVFALLVNLLSAGLALVGLLGYVFVYSLWLKRSTPSNIVIGGAAGAVPPMVGWAAVTGEIGSLTAWYLFAIVFFWTPPHFWSLALLIRKHYERANIPMLPVVRGDGETRWQIVLYSLLLVALSLVLAPFGLMGLVYFAAAAVLGGGFLYCALRLWREASAAAARRLYGYSVVYLFALFVVMAVDRAGAARLAR